MVKRGVGWCANEDEVRPRGWLREQEGDQEPGCEKRFAKCFLVGSDVFRCPVCRRDGLAEMESFSVTGQPESIRQVRVEYAYDTRQRIYRDVLVLTDHDADPKGFVYEVRSPMIVTEKRALATAQSAFSAMIYDRTAALAGVPSVHPVAIDFDQPRDVVFRGIQEIGHRIERGHGRRT